ncbi:hypothetical protein BCR33DRAFT_714734 [Rhizoclosmatium globosum]|uniref:Uncharacterized protein n=1 Tax=Rhizoclosmatium globosum TaxID=329046 RepID=A0A1Y2CKU1_9FUNG|nr:hypothetical protein BCR33DRAFT_714734 [Rhizoclosmatium globosum]|eukprot:ORY47632.1 hypothetical protein BCR33DRAFT_714734 [Rhizoclosmatium globosum]
MNLTIQPPKKTPMKTRTCIPMIQEAASAAIPSVKDEVKDPQIDIYAPLSYAEYSHLLAVSIPSTASTNPTTNTNKFLVLQRGSSTMPYLRLFWNEDDAWFQESPFVFRDDVTEKALSTLSGIQNGKEYKMGQALFRALRIHLFQVVFERVDMKE